MAYVLHGLDALHAADFVHCDVREANILKVTNEY
jgi:serine/threonine protein kinase